MDMPEAEDLRQRINRSFFDSLATFQYPDLLGRPVFLNSVPKCGTMLLRNILAHFAGRATSHWPFQMSTAALDALEPHLKAGKRFCTGHLPRDVRSSEFMRSFKLVCLVRHPRDQALSYARHLFVMPEDGTRLSQYVHARNPPFEEILTYCLLGVDLDGEKTADIAETFLRIGLAWFPRADCIVKYEDLRAAVENLQDANSEAFFHRLLQSLDITVPSDWRERVQAGAAKERSMTYLGNRDPVRKDWNFTDATLRLFEAKAGCILKALDYH